VREISGFHESSGSLRIISSKLKGFAVERRRLRISLSGEQEAFITPPYGDLGGQYLTHIPYDSIPCKICVKLSALHRITGTLPATE
jgi:hypothetical protein